MTTVRVRLAALNFPRHDLKQPSTVFGGIVRISATTSLALPCAANSKISLSWLVRCGLGARLSDFTARPSSWICNSLFHHPVNSFPIHAAADCRRIHSKRSSHFLVAFRSYLNRAVRYLRSSPLHHYLFLLSDFRSNR